MYLNNEIMNVSQYIKQALDENQGYNPRSNYLREYYRILLTKADEHHRIVQTNKDDGFISIYEQNKKYLKS